MIKFQLNLNVIFCFFFLGKFSYLLVNLIEIRKVNFSFFYSNNNNNNNDDIISRYLHC